MTKKFAIAVRQAAISCLVAAVGIVPVTTSGQEATAQQGMGSASPPVVTRLDEVPQITPGEVHPPAAEFRTGVSPAVYAAMKARAARQRGTAPADGSVPPATPSTDQTTQHPPTP
jgi:hypothetical protein